MPTMAKNESIVKNHDVGQMLAEQANASNYRKDMAERLNTYAMNTRDKPAQRFAKNLGDIQDYLRQAADGHVNQRRHLIKQTAEERLSKAMQEYHMDRYAMAEGLKAEAIDAARKELKPASSDRLLDLMESQMKYSAMSDEELSTLSIKTAALKDDGQVALTAKSHQNVLALTAELAKRNLTEEKTQLRDRLAKIPPECIGSPDAARLLSERHHYADTQDTETVYLADPGGRYGIDPDTLLDYSGLERVPE